MTVAEPQFTIGIEEEYLLVDRESRDLIAEDPKGMMKECEKLLAEQVAPEFPYPRGPSRWLGDRGRKSSRRAAWPVPGRFPGFPGLPARR